VFDSTNKDSAVLHRWKLDESSAHFVLNGADCLP